ncbi:hypothetical protein [Altererythrobacter aquiaggeris]|uniref:hypothetical protein n=1 Tax=Aestuarierythrobacter aquiaggeris TaxID=1898396 RepID=UPI003016BD95
MSDTNLQSECDRLSSLVDAVQFERLRWNRTEGPMLEKLVKLTHAAIEQRPDFELTEEASTPDMKRYVIKIHSKRVFGIALAIADGQAVMTSQPADRSPYKLLPGEPLAAPMLEFDEAWVETTLQTLMRRVQNA